MKTKSEEKINSKEILSDLYYKLRYSYGCHYLSLYVEEPNNFIRFGFLTNPHWKTNFIDYGLIKHCPLMKAGRLLMDQSKTGSIIMPWETVKPINRFEEEVCEVREEHKIGRNGVSITTYQNGLRIMLAIAPERKSKDFMKEIANHPQDLQKSLRNILDFTRAYTGPISSDQETKIMVLGDVN